MDFQLFNGHPVVPETTSWFYLFYFAVIVEFVYWT